MTILVLLLFRFLSVMMLGVMVTHIVAHHAEWQFMSSAGACACFWVLADNRTGIARSEFRTENATREPEAGEWK